MSIENNVERLTFDGRFLNIVFIKHPFTERKKPVIITCSPESGYEIMKAFEKVLIDKNILNKEFCKDD